MSFHLYNLIKWMARIFLLKSSKHSPSSCFLLLAASSHQRTAAVGSTQKRPLDGGYCQVFTTPLLSAMVSPLTQHQKYNHFQLMSLFFWFVTAAELEERWVRIYTKKGGDSQGHIISKYKVTFANQSLALFQKFFRMLPYFCFLD